MNREDIEHNIKIWEKVVDVQMHFNDLCLKVRNVAISILGVLLGAAALSFRYAGSDQAAIFIFVAIVVWIAFYLMDRYWYHELLKGAVHHGQEIEKSLKEKIPAITLAHTIRDQSHSSLGINAARKLDFFYFGIFAILIVAFVFTART